MQRRKKFEARERDGKAWLPDDPNKCVFGRRGRQRVTLNGRFLCVIS